MKKRFENFEKNFDQTDLEYVSDSIREHIMISGQWNGKKYKDLEWSLTVNLIPWED
tara:strand:- start:587 stop:754 length:168 start_codon:yes stop_codon:yes gene_type:complete